MTDNFVPNADPPPHPGFQAQNQNTGPLGGQVQVGNSPGPAPSMQPQAPDNPFSAPPKKKVIPKFAIFILLGLFVIMGILGSMILLRGKGTGTLVGTEGELTWWGVSEDSQVVRPLIEEFQSNNPNVKITYIKQSKEDYRERLTNALASGQGPDIFEIHNSWGTMFKNEISVAPGNIISRDDFIKSFYPVTTVDLSNAEGVFAIPLEYDALTLYINKDIFTSALKTPPSTWIELSELAKENELTQRGQNKLITQSGVALGLTENVDYWPEIFALMMIQNGANLAKPTADVTRDAASFYTSFNKGINSWDATMPKSTLAFARGRLAMYFAPVRSVADIKKENPNVRFRTVPLPQLPKELPTDPDVSYATYWAQSVWKRSRNTQTAWSFLKFLSTSENLQKLNSNRRNLNIQEKAYPKMELAPLQRDDEILGSLIFLAPSARSWYLAYNTYDGPTGINSQINSAYESVINAVVENADINKAISALQGKIDEIIAKFSSTRR